MIINYRQAVPMVDTGPDDNTLLLLHGEDISDSSKYGLSIQNVGGVVSSEARCKFGKKSLYFDGNYYLAVPQMVFPSGTQDYTVDWWQYMTSSDVVYNAGVVSVPFIESGGYGLLVGFWSAGKSNMTVYLGASNGTFNIVERLEMGPILFDQWQHYAVVRASTRSKYMIFNNGQKVTEWVNTSSVDPLQGTMFIGAYNYDWSYAKKIKGYIDELRISNVARWTENFTPPVAPY